MGRETIEMARGAGLGEGWVVVDAELTRSFRVVRCNNG